MLSAETSAGKHPVEAVRVMARIAAETERSIHKAFPELSKSEKLAIPEIIAEAAYHSAQSAGAVALAVGTATGASARLLARHRPPVPIYAFTLTEAVARQLSVVYGVHSIMISSIDSTDGMIQEIERLLVETHRAKPGDRIVFVAGQPVGLRGSTNMLKLHQITGL